MVGVRVIEAELCGAAARWLLIVRGPFSASCSGEDFCESLEAQPSSSAVNLATLPAPRPSQPCNALWPSLNQT